MSIKGEFALAMTLAACLCGCGGRGEKAPAARPPEVAVVTVAPRTIPVTVEFVAQTQSSHQVNIQARVSGFLERQAYTEGAIVKAGQVLFVMDKKPFVAQVNAMAAALARQKAAQEVARLNLARTKPLAAKNAVSQKDLDDAIGNYQATSAATEQAKAQLDTARLNLSYCTIFSPIDGITGAAQEQEGAYLSPSHSLLTTVATLSPIWVNFSLSENEMQRFRNEVASGAIIPPKDRRFEVEVVLVDGSIFPHKGTITFAAPSYNAKTGTFLLRAVVDNPRGVLKPNQYVRARLKGGMRPNAVVVPQVAVQQGAKGHFVWVVDRAGKAETRPVTVGEWHETGWLIREGLHAGDRVVVNGLLTLQPGTPVTVKAAAEPAAAVPAGPQESSLKGTR